MRPLIKKLFPKSTRRERRKLEVGIIILLSVMTATTVFVAVIFYRLITHRHIAQ
jgi:hypothetical protein